MVTSCPALALVGSTEVITGGRLAGGPWATITVPGEPFASLVYVAVARSDAVPPASAGAVTLQLAVLDSPSAIVPSGIGVVGAMVQFSGPLRLTEAPEIAPGPASVRVAVTVVVCPAASDVGVGGSRVSETAADCARSTARPPTWAIVTASLVGRLAVRTWTVAVAASYDQPGRVSPETRCGSRRWSTVTSWGSVRSTRSTS